MRQVNRESESPIKTKVLFDSSDIPFIGNSNINEKMFNYSNLNLDITVTATLVKNICRALCDWQDRIFRDGTVTKSQVPDIFKEDSIFLSQSEKADRPCRLMNDMWNYLEMRSAVMCFQIKGHKVTKCYRSLHRSFKCWSFQV